MGLNEGIEFGIATVSVFLLTIVLEYVRMRRTKQLENHTRNQFANAASCFIFLILTAAGYIHNPEGDPSILITAAAGMQLFAVVLLYCAPRPPSPSRRAPGAFGLLLCYCLAARVYCTSYYSGYLPADETGDGCLQTLEGLAGLVVAFGLVREAPTGKDALAALKILAGIAVVSFLVFGELDHRVNIDRLYASSLYAELLAWVVMLQTIYHRSAEDVDGIFALPSFVQAACRAYTWAVAIGELTPKAVHNPIYFMDAFPVVSVGVHVGMLAVTAGICVVCLRDVELPELHACMNLV